MQKRLKEEETRSQLRSAPRINPQSNQMVSHTRKSFEKIEDRLIREGQAQRKRLEMQRQKEELILKRQQKGILTLNRPLKSSKKPPIPNKKVRKAQPQQNLSKEYLDNLSMSLERK
jgi:hypothetical protein